MFQMPNSKQICQKQRRDHLFKFSDESINIFECVKYIWIGTFHTISQL
uniref:Uncharacterized protein n=1 Tax=Anguilla anguilla TaxID=7936 RepID=A0A0E9V5A6_ANGAN